MTTFIDAYGLKDFESYLQLAPKIATQAARMAINDTVERKGVRMAREAMLKQVAWPAGYLVPPRFEVKYKATDANLESVLRGRETPTSLARFTGRTIVPRGRRGRPFSRREAGPSAPGIVVNIRPGSAAYLHRAFLINLRSGNLGLGVRLRAGEVLHNTIGAKLIIKGPLRGVALLYGPSVDQVFRSVAVDISPPLLDALSAEFLRQWIRLS